MYACRSETMRSILGLIASVAPGSGGTGGVDANSSRHADGLLLSSTTTGEFLNGIATTVGSSGAGSSTTKSHSRGHTTKSTSKSNIHPPVPVPEINRMEVARKSYATRYTGLEGYGDSGMTVLEELIDVAYQLCEKQSKQFSDDRTVGEGKGQVLSRSQAWSQGLIKGRDTRAAALLAADGRVYTGVDIYTPLASSCGDYGVASTSTNAAMGMNVNQYHQHHNNSHEEKTSAEVVALLGAATENCTQFVGMVIASDTLPPGSFPVPDGKSREYLRSFGQFSVFLVNSCLECRDTNTNELFPISGNGPTGSSSNLARSFSAPLVIQSITPATHMGYGPSASMVEFALPVNSSYVQNPHPPSLDILRDEDVDIPLDKWTVNDVVAWLKCTGFEDYADQFAKLKVDGTMLCHMSQEFLRDQIGLAHALHRKKLLRLVEHKRAAIEAHYAQNNQNVGSNLDEMDDYVMMLDTQRISLVAKLKTVFDAFATTSNKNSGGVGVGLASGEAIEQMLVYMNKPIDSVDVNRWLGGLKEAASDRNSSSNSGDGSEAGARAGSVPGALTFADFVSQYCSLFGGHDPDVPVGEGGGVITSTSASSKGTNNKGKRRHKNKDNKSRSRSKEGESGGEGGEEADSGEHWVGDSNDSASGDSSSGSSGHGSDNDSDEGGNKQSHSRGSRRALVQDQEDILNIQVLAELKIAFDRFAVGGMITPSECIQALSEVGLIVPRKDVISYLRARQLLGITRNISYYEFLRGFAALK